MKSVKFLFREGYSNICAVIAAIPFGRVASYGEIASRAGVPGRARLVGRVLREAGETIVLPWHRVLRANGSIAFPLDSAAFIEQRQRLRSEGVVIRGARVDLRVFGWQRDLDSELWAPVVDVPDA
jgi:methylated-DNA-protein-cysteine methyltransferase related protein